MRGNEQEQDAVFSYVSLEQRVPTDHPLRAIRKMVDRALRELSPHFDGLYASTGRPSIAPEKLLRALLVQALYGKRSERLLMEELDYSLLFRWFVGLGIDEEVWDGDGVQQESGSIDRGRDCGQVLCRGARPIAAIGAAERRTLHGGWD